MMPRFNCRAHLLLGCAAHLCLLGNHAVSVEPKTVIVIAHRGASGYLPEHTLAAKALAYGMGADFIEQDVVLTKDDHPIVLHDIVLDAVSDVARRFPSRARDDGRYYAIDFSLAEIKQLRVCERIDPATGVPVYPRRFPGQKSGFSIPTLAEEIELIQGLNHSTGRTVGIYPEIKAPAWHREHGKDISTIVLKQLRLFGYNTAADPCYLQCFDVAECRRWRRELKTGLRLVQLIGDADGNGLATNHDPRQASKELAEIATYAQAIGPPLEHVVQPTREGRSYEVTQLVALAHRHGLQVHPFTFRGDDLPPYAASLEELLEIFVREAHVDGLFTDFPDRAVQVISALGRRGSMTPHGLTAPPIPFHQ